MARTRTLAQLRSDVCDRADVTDGGSGGRHTSARLNRYINQAIQRYVNLANQGGGEWFVKRSTVTGSASTTEDTAGWAPNQYIAMPSDFASLVGIDITVGSTTVPMMQFERVERDSFLDSPSWLASNGTGQPVYYRLGGTNQAGSKIAQVIPAADQAYTFEVWYIPAITDLSSDSDTFDGTAGYEEYVAIRAAVDCLINDGNTSTALYGALKMDLDEMEKEMRFKFASMGGAGRRVNTRAYRERLQSFARRWWVV
jgi:hypothetical protein